MSEFVKKTMQHFAHICGYEISRKHLLDFSDTDNQIIESVRPYTMTSPLRVYALIEAVRYVIENKIPGSIVECGVWKGGSMMAVAKTLMQLNYHEKDLYLFDTFEGMTEPKEIDISNTSLRATKIFHKTKINESSSNWCRAPLDEVQKFMHNTGYDKKKIHFIKGMVENTIPEKAPEEISILRLDTDWYESTKHEMNHLFPRISRGGVLIIDDYGFWKGARKAVDEYIRQNEIQILLNRIDETGRIGVKM